MRDMISMFLRAGLVLLGGIGTVHAGLVIQEIYYDQSGGDGTDVFTELYNPGPSVDLTGWSLVGINGADGSPYKSIYLTGVLSSNALLLIAGNDVPDADYYINIDWQNGPDALQLVDDQGRIVDAVQYGDASSHNSGEGTPAPDAPPGYSLSRDARGTDTHDNFADFSVGIPSPGVGPAPSASLPVSVPLPGAVWLLGSGLLGWLGFKK